MLEKILIQNFKAYEKFELEFNTDMNIIVGDNEAGKSTLLEAINLALTSKLTGKSLQAEISPHLFNQSVAKAYVDGINSGTNPVPPEIVVDLYLARDADTAKLMGTNNLTKEDKPGVRVRIAFNSDYASEYKTFVDAKTAVTIPVEYYSVEWMSFSGSAITYRSVPVAASLINASNIRLQNGADYYLQKIIEGHLTDKESVELARAYRDLKQSFSSNTSIVGINTKLDATKGDVSEKVLSLGVDLSQKSGWESGLIPHLDDLPFHLIGSGEQNTLKILLAINRKIEESHAILIEEPENHLSFSTLHKLIAKIDEKCDGRQVIITTHSSYVINKLGLAKLILLHDQKVMKMTDLSTDTQDYFMKLPGYDTLRLVLAKRTIIVEGPSDELVVQRAYKDTHGHLPIDDGVDILSVRGLSPKRFLEIAAGLNKTACVVTDNDGNIAAVQEKYKDYADNANVKIFYGDDEAYPSLEQTLVKANGLTKMNTILGRKDTDVDKLVKHMKISGNKTMNALKIFSTTETVQMPGYIADAVK